MRHNRVENKLRRSIDFISAFAGEATVAEATADFVWDPAQKLLFEGMPPEQRIEVVSGDADGKT